MPMPIRTSIQVASAVFVEEAATATAAAAAAAVEAAWLVSGLDSPPQQRTTVYRNPNPETDSNIYCMPSRVSNQIT